MVIYGSGTVKYDFFMIMYGLGMVKNDFFVT